MKDRVRKMIPGPVREYIRLAEKQFNILLSWLISLALFPFSLLVLSVLFIVEPFRKCRIYPVGYCPRFGLQIKFTDRILRLISIDKDRNRILPVILLHSPANRTQLDMVKRKACVIENRFINRIADYMSVLLKHTRFFSYVHQGPHLASLYPSLAKDRVISPVLKFTEDEIRQGYEKLAEMGVGKNDWYVCFHNRDSAFDNWNNHHEYRNCSLNSYLQAAEYVASLGGYAIRVGSKVEEPIPNSANANIIDYASSYRSDFMDIFLLAHCRFFLGNSSGVFVCAMVFDKPVIMANMLGWTTRPPRESDYFLMKPLRKKDEDRLLDYQEIKSMGLELTPASTLAGLHGQGLEYQENSGQELIDACKDMFSQLEGKACSGEISDLQHYFDNTYLSPAYEYVKDYSKIAPSFANKYKDLIMVQ